MQAFVAKNDFAFRQRLLLAERERRLWQEHLQPEKGISQAC